MSNLLKSTLQNNAHKQRTHQLPTGFVARPKEVVQKNGASSSTPSLSPSPSKQPVIPPPSKSLSPWPGSMSIASGSSSPVGSPGYSSEIEEVPGPKKKKQRVKQAVVYSQPADTGTGSDINTQLVYAVRKLKEHGNPIRLEDLSARSDVPLDTRPDLLEKFRAHDRVIHDVKTNTYSYKPDFNIRNKEQLLTEITRHHKKGGGMSVKVIRDSWPGAGPAIEDLANRGDIIVTRTAKDGQPRMVFLNEVLPADGGVPVDKEFQEIWHAQRVPDEDIVKKELGDFGQQEASVETTQKPIAGRGRKGKKGAAKVNRRIKITNTHLIKAAGIDLTKDYVPVPAVSK